MHEIDYQIAKGLHEMQLGMTALTSTRQTTHEKLAMLKADLDERWQAELQPLIRDLYWHPFVNGIDEAPVDEQELRSWLEDKYDDAAIIALLLLLMLRYSQESYNLGGQIGLDFLGIDEVFGLEDADIIAEIERFNADLLRRGSEFSLIDTTIDDLVRELPKAREAEGSTVLALSLYIALRSVQRSEAIDRTERPRWVGSALEATFQRNGVAYMMYDVNGVGCPRICAPWHGTVFPVGGQTVGIPQHIFCDCIWSPVLHDGQAVGSPPIIVSVPGLPAWNAPGVIWTGQ